MSNFDFQRIEEYLRDPNSNWLLEDLKPFPRHLGGTFIPYYIVRIEENRVQRPTQPGVGHTFRSRKELEEYLRGEMRRLAPGVSMLKDQWQKNMPDATLAWISVSMASDGTFYLLLLTSQGKIEMQS